MNLNIPTKELADQILRLSIILKELGMILRDLSPVK